MGNQGIVLDLKEERSGRKAKGSLSGDSALLTECEGDVNQLPRSIAGHAAFRNTHGEDMIKSNLVGSRASESGEPRAPPPVHVSEVGGRAIA